ncbi:DUF4870 domain-containing protein [Siminovitchia sp. FSL W7-1587]|uniref:DUF4870 domain-containing protein n=1 Tax=Siminovitchia sp. FSL W7-1587 TaxID=2954699 RepID=UPI0030D4DFF4
MDDHHEIGPQKENDRKSSTGLEENVAGLLCYLGTFVTGIIFFILEKKSPFVKFHAMQSMVLYATLWIVGTGVSYVPFVGWLFKLLISLVGFILWVLLMVQTYHRERIKVPVVGDIAENLVQHFNGRSQ